MCLAPLLYIPEALDRNAPSAVCPVVAGWLCLGVSGLEAWCAPHPGDGVGWRRSAGALQAVAVGSATAGFLDVPGMTARRWRDLCVVWWGTLVVEMLVLCRIRVVSRGAVVAEAEPVRVGEMLCQRLEGGDERAEDTASASGSGMPRCCCWWWSSCLCATVWLRAWAETTNWIDSDDHFPVTVAQELLLGVHALVAVVCWTGDRGAGVTAAWPCLSASVVSVMYALYWHRTFAPLRRMLRINALRAHPGYVAAHRHEWYDGVCATCVAWSAAWLWSAWRVDVSRADTACAQPTPPTPPAPARLQQRHPESLAAAVLSAVGMVVWVCDARVWSPWTRVGIVAGGVALCRLVHVQPRGGAAVLCQRKKRPPASADPESPHTPTHPTHPTHPTCTRCAVATLLAMCAIAHAVWVPYAYNVATRHAVEYQDAWAATLVGWGMVGVWGVGV